MFNYEGVQCSGAQNSQLLRSLLVTSEVIKFFNNRWVPVTHKDYVLTMMLFLVSLMVQNILLLSFSMIVMALLLIGGVPNDLSLLPFALGRGIMGVVVDK